MRLLQGNFSALGRRLLIIVSIAFASLQAQPAMSQVLDDSGELMWFPGLPDTGMAADQTDYGQTMWGFHPNTMTRDDADGAMFMHPQQQHSYLNSATKTVAGRQAAKTRKLAQKAARIAKNKAKLQAKGNPKGNAKNVAQNKTPAKSPLD